MESSKRSSFDDMMSIAGSGFWRSNRSPTRSRLGRRRSGAGSLSSESLKSFGSEKQSTCVTRETSSDECALHRFIVWVAVKRNACPKMTNEERRECPLLRCRKRCQNHEDLLQHLYSCGHLEGGEYWCYDCGKAEKLHDIKCRRCPGQPSRCRRLMAKAKSVFSSLGRVKHANPPLFGFDMDDHPPVYSPLPHDARPSELQSNEIHEIGSSQALLPPGSENSDTICSKHPEQLHPAYEAFPVSKRSMQAACDTPMPLVDDSLINWDSICDPSFSSAEPEHPTRQTLVIRPPLQVDTTIFEGYRSGAGCRSKFLEASNSVRSTDSATSTKNSTSTVSCTVSPLSAWSGNWGNSQGINSTLTSPADDVPPLEDKFPCNQPPALNQDIGGGETAFNRLMDGCGGLFELPAEIPKSIEDFDLYDPETFQDTSLQASSSGNYTIPPDNVPAASFQPNRLAGDLRTGRRQTSAPRLVRSARDTLELHLAESKSKLIRVVVATGSRTSLASQLYSMSSSSVATVGLEAMLGLLRGERAASSLELLCFIHVAYSFSFVVLERTEDAWWAELFSRCLSYGNWLSDKDRHAYSQLVEILWRPNNMADDFAIRSRNNIDAIWRKTGEPQDKAVPAFAQIDDLLLTVSAYFLDEFEYAALQEETKPYVRSELCLQHLRDLHLDTTQSLIFSQAAESAIASLCQQHCVDVSFVRSMSKLRQAICSNRICTTRRLELELMHRGKMFSSSKSDGYIQQVRSQIDVLQTRKDVNCLPRRSYQKLGIRLIASLMQAPELSAQPIESLSFKPPKPTTVSREVETTKIPDNIVPDNWADLNVALLSLYGGASASLPAGIGATLSTSQPQSSSDSSCHSTQMPCTHSPSTSTCEAEAATAPSNGDKVEADMKCEICGYRPKGDPKWFQGSMAKHKKLQHGPIQIFACPWPGCNSQYRNRADNLRQHQIEKNHFVHDQDGTLKRKKRRKVE